MRLTRFFILLMALLIMSACSSEEGPEESAAESEINQEEEAVAEEETEEAEEQEITIGNVESIDFSEMDENEALRIEQSELNEPTLAGSYHNMLYYLDGDFVTTVASTGDEDATFRYDLENDSVMWKNTDYKGSSASTQLHNDVFYMSDNWNKEHAAVVALSIEDESILGTYEHEGYERTHDIQVFDDYLLMYAREKGGDIDDSYLLNFDLSSGEFLWAEPVFRVEEAVETEDAFLYQMKEYSTEEEGFVAFDKQTGEQLYKLPGVTNLDKPIVNSSNIYLFNYDEDAISAYDFDGELVETFNLPGTLVNPHLLLPHATDDFIIYADEEAIIWMESDLSEELGRIEMGEDTALHRMIYTEDFLYAIVKDGDSEIFYVVIIDKVSGEIGEKFPIEYEYHGGKDIVHVYNDKFHFSIHESDEEGLKRVHYIHSGLKGESVHR